jgi:hypothetical protein
MDAHLSHDVKDQEGTVALFKVKYFGKLASMRR